VLGTDRERVTRLAVTASDVSRIDYVALEGRGQSEPDVQEMYALETALEGDLPAMGAATGTSGALLGAAFATSLAAGVLAIDLGAVPGGTRVHAALRDRVRVVHDSSAHDATVRSALVIGTDAYNQAGAVVVTAAEGTP